MAQQVHDMLAKELFLIKPGTFIKGFSVTKKLGDRKATFSSGEWKFFKDKSIDSIRTPFFYPINSKIHLKTYNGVTATKLLKTNNFPTDNWTTTNETYMNFKAFSAPNPIGIHLDDFSIAIENMDENMVDYIIYTKMLLCNGEVGYLAFYTMDLTKKELELL